MGDLPPSSSGSFSDASLAEDIQQVKGLAFASIQTYLTETFGERKWKQLMELLPPRTTTLFEDIDTAEWYPETEARRVIHLIFEQLAEENEERFSEIMRGIATTGINRFFRMILTITTGHFVMRNIPTFWKRVRRGPATLTTETTDTGRVLVHYNDFRYCRDRLYRLTSLANCQAAAFAATKKMPKAEIVVWERYSMTLGFTFDEK